MTGDAVAVVWSAYVRPGGQDARVTSADRSVEFFDFEHDYEVVVDPEFPGDGDWRCEVFGFGRGGEIEEPFHSVWGAPLVVEVSPSARDRWVGQYASGGLGGISGVYACPSTSQLCVVVDGEAYLTDVNNPRAGSIVVHDQVGQVLGVEGRSLLLLVRFIDIVALGPQGIAWKSKRLAVDDLRVVRAIGDTIECTLDNLGGSDTIGIDANTGEQTEGTRLDSFWPPDALA